MLPTGFPWLLRLSRLLILTENVNEYGRFTGGLAGGFDAAPALAVAGLLAFVVAPPAGAGVLGSIALPNLNVLSTFKLISAKPGPRPKTPGIIGSPGDGVGSKAPRGVITTPGLLRSVANAGRSLKIVSPLVSRPVVMLKGTTQLKTIKVLIVRSLGSEYFQPPYAKLSPLYGVRAHS